MLKNILIIFYLLLMSIPVFPQELLGVVSRETPKYSPTARAVGANGQVEVLVGVDPDGKVISSEAFTGHPLLRNVSREAAAKWKFEKFPKESGTKSIVLTFIFMSGDIRVIEKSSQSTEEVNESSYPGLYAAISRVDTLVPKLLLLPRVKDSITARACEMHEEAMEVETLPAFRGDRDDEGRGYDENYFEAKWEQFPNANNIYYGYHLNEATEKVEVHFCKTCRAKRERWIIEHKINN